ncbi:hypothetical protein ACLESD_34280, partial [Pyxidicoccus sp. 3LFB2]
EQPVFVGLSVTMPESVPGARLALELMHRTTPHIPLMVGGNCSGELLDEAQGAWTVLDSTGELLALTRGGAGGHLLPR